MNSARDPLKKVGHAKRAWLAAAYTYTSQKIMKPWL